MTKRMTDRRLVPRDRFLIHIHMSFLSITNALDKDATNRSKEIKDWLIDGFLFGLQTIILEQSLRTKRKEHKMKEIKEKD